MYSRLSLQLETSQPLYPNTKSSLFQGVLMEQISPDYAEKMHENDFHPYSMHIEGTKEGQFWVINTLTDEAREEIIKPLLRTEFDHFVLTHDGTEVKIVAKSEEIQDPKELVRQMYTEEAESFLYLRFLTPTAFKQQGRYTFYPDLRCIYQSLMMRYSAVSTENEMLDEEMLDNLVKISEISQYQLRSCYFQLNGTRIPSFLGETRLYLHGNQTMKSFIRLLFRFGEYSGIGVKTSIGMGAIEMNQERRRKGVAK